MTTTLPTGLEALRGIIAGAVEPPPMAEFLDLELLRADPGEAVFRIDTRPQTGNGIGLIHGGLLATLMDFACSSAASTELPAGAFLTTIELKVSTCVRCGPRPAMSRRSGGHCA